MPVHVSDKLTGWTALHRATQFNRADVIKRLLYEGIDMNIQTRYFKDTSLHFAAEYNYTEVARLFIDNGADVNIQNEEYKTLLDYVHEGSEVERLILQFHNVQHKGTFIFFR